MIAGGATPSVAHGQHVDRGSGCAVSGGSCKEETGGSNLHDQGKAGALLRAKEEKVLDIKPDMPFWESLEKKKAGGAKRGHESHAPQPV